MGRLAKIFVRFLPRRCPVGSGIIWAKLEKINVKNCKRLIHIIVRSFENTEVLIRSRYSKVV